MIKPIMKRLLLILVIGGLIGGWGFNAWALSKTISLPITLDYPLIRSFLVSQFYTQPGQKAVLQDQNKRCVRIELSDPGIRSDGSLILIANKVKLQAGLESGKRCRRLIEWEGYVEIRMKPYWEQETWRLRFETQDTNFFNQEHKKSRVAKIVWKVIEKYVHPPLDRVVINMAPPLNEVTQLLPLYVKPEQQEKFKMVLGSLRAGPLKVGPEAVEAEILFDWDVPDLEIEKTPAPLTDAERARLVKIWETWDSFLVHELLSLAGQALTAEERNILLKTMLEMRHGFVQALGEKFPEQDLVRQQFVKSWAELRPIMRKYLIGEDSPTLFGYLGYITIMDSLKILHNLGEALGLEISQDGLIRLARVLSKVPVPWDPRYAWEVNPELRKLLGLETPVQENDFGYEGDELDLPASTVEDLSLHRGPVQSIRFISTSQEAEKQPQVSYELMKWLPDGKNVDDYLERVKKVLQDATEKVLAKGSLDKKYHDWFSLLVSATAWQESCWRQLILSGGKIRSLFSYDGSSVGLMQINTRVWRGLYQPRDLRWNIRYNALAGAEILELYFRRYALKRPVQDATLPSEFLGGAVYAMYNGGPAQFSLFLRRQREGRLKSLDRLFLEKYGLVKNGSLERLRLCFEEKKPE